MESPHGTSEPAKTNGMLHRHDIDNGISRDLQQTPVGSVSAVFGSGMATVFGELLCQFDVKN